MAFAGKGEITRWRMWWFAWLGSLEDVLGDLSFVWSVICACHGGRGGVEWGAYS